MKFKIRTLKSILNNLTASEIDFLLYTLQFQNDRGVVRGITCKKVVEAIHIHRSNFYDILKSLQQKGIIELIRTGNKNQYYANWEFKMLDNEFTSALNYKEGYIKINIVFLHSKEFLKLTKSEKVICLNFLMLYRHERKDMKFTFEKLMEWTGKKLQSIKKYVKNIKKVFSQLQILDNAVNFHFDKDNLRIEFREIDTATNIFNKHDLDFKSRISKVKATNAELEAASAVISGRSKVNPDILTTAVMLCLKKTGKLIAPYINKMIDTVIKDKLPLITI